MTTSIDYLEAARIEEIASQLRDEGFSVTSNPGGDDQGFDLVAERNNKKIAVEVKFNGRLSESAETIKALRRRALNHGYDEFRLVVVSPPREVRVSIERLGEELFNYIGAQDLLSVLAGHHVNDLFELGLPEGKEIRLIGVGQIDIASIDISVDGVQVVGNGVVEIEFDYWALQEEPVLTTWKTDLPFAFDIILNRDLTISKALRIEVDTSSLLGD